MARAILIADVTAKTSLKKSAIYEKIAAGKFPAPAKLGSHRTVWLEEEIDKWVADQFAARDGATTEEK